MAEAVVHYVQAIWGSTLPIRLAQAILVAALFEALVWVLNWRLRKAFSRVLARDLHRETTMRVLRRRVVLGLPLLASRAVLYTLAILLILRLLGFRTGAELLPVGLALVLVILVAFRYTLADTAAGYFILYDDLYGIGERVTIGEITGQVDRISLRFTKLVTNDGREISIANSSIKEVINHSRATGA